MKIESESCFKVKLKEIAGSENFKEICEFGERGDREDMFREEAGERDMEKFKEGSRIFADWTAQTFGGP